MPEVDLVCDNFSISRKFFVTNQKPPELSAYTFKPVCRHTSDTLRQTSKIYCDGVDDWFNFTGFFSSVNNDFFFH